MIIIGRNPVIEALKANSRIEKIYIQRGAIGKPIGIIKDLAGKNNITVSVVDNTSFKNICKSPNAQGVAALMGVKKYEDLDSLLNTIASQKKNNRPLILILDAILDPYNLGALIRTAECAGFDGVILPKHHTAPLTETAMKSSAGGIEHISIARVTNIVATIKRLKDEGYWIIGADGSADKQYDEVDYASPTAIIIGSEGKGIRPLVKEKCDYLVKIPTRGRIDSLNASVAGGIIMYEAVRQRS